MSGYRPPLAARVLFAVIVAVVTIAPLLAAGWIVFGTQQPTWVKAFAASLFSFVAIWLLWRGWTRYHSLS
jgi:hypothetical protein